MAVNWNRVKYDLEYIILNRFVNCIPSWTIRRFFYKYYGMKIHTGARIGIGTVVVYPSGIEIGHRSIVNENCFIDGRGGLRIGRDTSISTYTKIVTGSHDYNSDTFEHIRKLTIIGDRVWIGINAVILDGSRIKNRSVIGASSVVKGLVEEDSIVIGNPAKPVKKRQLNNKRFRMQYYPYFR